MDETVARAPPPQLTCSVQSDAFGLVGHLAIHNLVRGQSLGGVRLVADADLVEISAAARTMAYKYGFIGLPMDGAKAVVAISAEREVLREEMLVAFGEALAPLIEHGAYIPGIDMNCTMRDLEHIYRGAGLHRDWSRRRHASHTYTAWTCFICSLVSLEARGIKPEHATFAVQGFGQVGADYAALMTGAGARLVALSNQAGALADEAGFDVAELVRARHRHGDRFIEQYPAGERVPHEQPLALPVTLLLPAARAWAIHEDNWRAVLAPIVICAANVAMSDAIERQLCAAGKTVVTDFVANCGGVVGSMMDQAVDKGVIWDILNTSHRAKVAGFHAQSHSSGESIGALARREAEYRMASWGADERARAGILTRRLGKLLPRGMRARQQRQHYADVWTA